jgi:hypothetical protein
MSVKLTLDQPATADDARQYLASYASRAGKLGRMARPLLADIAGRLVLGGVAGWSRDEMVNMIIADEYPDFRTAGHILAGAAEPQPGAGNDYYMLRRGACPQHGRDLAACDHP